MYAFISYGYIHLGVEHLGHMVILNKATVLPAENPWLLLVTVLPASLPFCCIISPTLGAVLANLSISSSGPPLPRGEHVIHILPITCPLPRIWFFGRGSVRLKGGGTHPSPSIRFLTSTSQSCPYMSTFSNVEFYHILPIHSLILFLPWAGQRWFRCLHPPLASSGTLSLDQSKCMHIYYTKVVFLLMLSIISQLKSSPPSQSITQEGKEKYPLLYARSQKCGIETRSWIHPVSQRQRCRCQSYKRWFFLGQVVIWGFQRAWALLHLYKKDAVKTKERFACLHPVLTHRPSEVFFKPRD